MLERVLTIGVYGFDEKAFFDALVAARVGLVADIRQRRGMRGSQYAFANATYLVARLRSRGLGYMHLRSLAPPSHIRELQREHDALTGELKRTRTVLSTRFKQAYEDEVLSHFSPKDFARELPPGVLRIAFLCVERDPEACHRLLAGLRVSSTLNLALEHIVP